MIAVVSGKLEDVVASAGVTRHGHGVRVVRSHHDQRVLFLGQRRRRLDGL